MASNWFDDEAGFYDFLMFVAMYAPDFPEEDFLNADEQLTLDRAFDELATSLQMMQNRLSNDRFQRRSSCWRTRSMRTVLGTT